MAGENTSPLLLKKPITTMADFNVCADSFIHLKKGNITQFYKVGEILGEGRNIPIIP